MTSEADGDAELLEVLRSLGVSEAAIERARERGYPEGAIFEAFIEAGERERTVSLRELEASGGPGVEQTAALMWAFGFSPEPEAPALTPEEAEALRELHRREDVWPHELALQLARLYGRLVGRIAHASVELFRLHVEPQLREGGDPAAGLRAIEHAFSSLYPIAPPLLIAVFRRSIEHELEQVAIHQAETAVAGRLPGAVELSLLFCDLKDFTAYAEAAGDESAARAVERLSAVVAEESGEGSRLLKALGDGFMLVYDEPAEAVEAGLRIIGSMRGPGSLGVHASAHHGTAVAREGDYYGGAVNLAARLLQQAGRDELVATAAVVERCPNRFDWEPQGAVEVRGVLEPVPIFRIGG